MLELGFIQRAIEIQEVIKKFQAEDQEAKFICLKAYTERITYHKGGETY